ncbi:Thioredoxin-related transmembrane protein 2-B [Choanephora cucurbitarum]|uniref:Thioredoxin-related transmembrane protein 2-B n=1 Tax=Choanephora cucurbitarum TaxID=101091 RepID=A0A1C7N0M5_9FUNG|nr:Thioredoxin-related transmembrane protein 2-B [Choanephora cucurbitarum]
MTSLSELRQRLLHPHYVIHLLYGLVYIGLRLNRMISENLISFEDTETRTFVLLAGLSVWKCLIAASAEELSSVLILYTKFFSLCSIFWRFGFWRFSFYAIGWIVLSTVFPQPWYSGPTKIYELSATAFRDKVLGKPVKQSTSSTANTSSSSSAPPSSSSSTIPLEDMKGPRITEIVDEDEKPQQQKQQSFDAKYWVVMLYANWSVACLNFEAVLAKLSIKYDVPHLKFGQIDIDLYPDLAEEFGVSKDPASFDLPTLILFQQGKEIRRLPELTLAKEDSKNTTANTAKDTITRLGWSKQPSTVVTMFQLEKICNEKSN